ncbi:MAG: ABC transporter permease [Reichenbachiella sp.]|uniref:ABC transporter permease n=1 Tax=Reichenbachiella sp. TaxID=2184521 RepID=UPI002966BF73|nr:ABC transporter permease [Reichenbachiella sp.]MDW3210825.1 ABC transporter permease [Reichenbachiella sp.]
MLKNYLKTALRYLGRQKGYTALNIIGLTIGISSSLIIILYLHNELSFDQYHEKADRIYRVSSDIKETDDAFRWAVTQNPLGQKLVSEFAEVEQYVRFADNGRTELTIGDISYFEEKVYNVDSTLFDVFTFNFILGDPQTALGAPKSIVLNKTVADKIFKGENPIGQSLRVDGGDLFQVTGVYKDMPKNSHLIADVLISVDNRPNMANNNWGGFNIFTYILLSPTADAEAFEIKLDEVIQEHVAPIFAQFNITIVYELINIKDIHLYSDFQGEPEPLGDITYIYIFSAVCVFMVFIACINYMNLATARSVKRATEVGIRKVMGAGRQLLIGQFLTESVLITICSFALSLILVIISIPIINNALGINLQLSMLAQPTLIGVMLLILLIAGIFGGSYPAFYLSAFLPAEVLKGGKSKRSGNAFLRKTLVVIQFSISIFMLIGTGIIYDQMQFVSNKNLGFDKDQVVTFTFTNGEQRAKWDVLKNKIMQDPNIKSAATSNSRPGQGFSKNLMRVEMEEGGFEEKGVNMYGVDYDYFPTLNIDFTEGRNFSREFPSDTATAVIINEAMATRFKWSNPIGKRFQMMGGPDTTTYFKVLGVVKDFHQQSLYNPIEPIMFFPRLNNNNALVKIERNPKEAVSSIKQSWAEVFPNLPLDYTYLDKDFQEQYETDQLRGSLFLGFSLMTIVISCMGLLGLASFTAEQRTKEISIRKVLGANVGGLIQLLIKDFLILVYIGAIPAFAVAWYFGQNWLQNFEYSVEINYLIFVGVLLVTMAITILSTGYFALRAATSNPADSLKYE